MIGRVAVWLDRLTPTGGSFAQGLDWAARLHVPLHGILVREAQRSRESSSPQREQELLDRCSDQCRRLDVSWDAAVCTQTPALAAGALACSNELCVFSHALAPVLWDALLHGALSGAETLALVCPETAPRLERVLIVNEDNGSDSGFLVSAAQLCKTLAAAPVVLTVARQERTGRRRELLAEDVFARGGVTAEFDLIVGADICQAVVLAARCRGCTHVFVERHPAPWWRWLRGDNLQRLLGLSKTLTFFTCSADGLLQPLVERERQNQRLESTEKTCPRAQMLSVQALAGIGSISPCAGVS